VNEIDAQLAASLARRFDLVRLLGQGGMGAVYLAEQIAVGNRPVALKVLSRKLLDDPNFLLRFQNEAASTGRIHHVNVVTHHSSLLLELFLNSAACILGNRRRAAGLHSHAAVPAHEDLPHMPEDLSG